MDRYRYLIPLLLCAVVRVGWLAAFPVDPIGPIDAEGFHLLAVNLRAGRGFAIGWQPPFCPTAVRTPLYPLFLAGVYEGLGPSPVRAVRAHVLLEVLATAGVIALARSIADALDDGGRGMTTRVGFWAGTAYALNGATTRYTGLLLAESLLVPLMAAALCATVRLLRQPGPRLAGLMGALWGLAVLTKPNVQYLVVGVVGLIGLRAGSSRRWRSAVVVSVAAIALVLAPWGARNVRRFDRWMISTAFEENLARVSAVATLAEVRGIRAEPWSETWEHLYAQFVIERTGYAPAEVEALPCPQRADWHRQVAHEARDWIGAHAGTALRVHLGGAVSNLMGPNHRYWYRIISGEAWDATGTVADVWARVVWSLDRGAWGDGLRAFVSARLIDIPPLAAAVWWGLLGTRAALAGLGIRGTRRLMRRTPWAALLLVGSAVYLCCLPGPIAYDRFVLPALPPIFSLAACGLYRHGCAELSFTPFSFLR